MKLLLVTVTLLATTWAQSLSSEYLPPVDEYSGASSAVVESNFLENEPAHSLADDGYRYKTVKRFRLRHRRDVSELSNSYLPPHATSAPEPAYSAPAESAPAPVYSAPAATETYEVEASEPAPAHSFGDDGYRYRAVKRYRLRRRRRDVGELSNSYLPPHAESAPAPVYSAPAETETYEVEASEPAPAHSFGDDGYRYKAVKRYRLRRRRRDVSELSNSYLPPHAESAPAPVYSAPAESAPAPVYSAPAATETYEVEASEPAPAHSFGDDGYRYKTVKRYRLRRRRRDVNELSNSYLPPHAASAHAPVYSAPAESAPAAVYSAPAATETYQVEASEPAPAHSFGDDGYRYKTVKRYRLRRRRDVSELSNSYLPPLAESAPAAVYSTPAATETYEVEASEPAPAHSFGDDGYRYRAVKRYRLRRRRDVSELSNSYLPPHAASAPTPVYSAPAESVPAPVYSAAPAATETYEVQASEPAPAHSLSDDGYRYRTVKRYRLRRRY